MGKRLRQQRRGKGSPRYRAPSHRYLGKVSYRERSREKIVGEVIDIVDAPGRTTPLAIVKFQDKKELMIPAQGIKVGDEVGYNIKCPGSVVELRDIPIGSKIYDIEATPGDGGKFCRSSGSFATLVAKGKQCVVRLPSKVLKTFSGACRASIGIPASGGRKEKPFLKAGAKWFAVRSFGRSYPRTKGVAMNPVDHPFGGSTKTGRLRTISRHAPPGKKVGSISPRRVGKKKK